MLVRPSLAAATEVMQRERFIRNVWPLKKDVPDRDACIAQVPIAIEFQVYDPLFVPKDVGGHRLTIDEIFSGPTAIGDIRQSASLQESLAQPGVSDWLGDSLTAKSLPAEHGDSCLSVCSQRHYLQQRFACRCGIIRAVFLSLAHFAKQAIFSIKTVNLSSPVPSPKPQRREQCDWNSRYRQANNKRYSDEFPHRATHFQPTREAIQ